MSADIDDPHASPDLFDPKLGYPPPPPVVIACGCGADVLLRKLVNRCASGCGRAYARDGFLLGWPFTHLPGPDGR